MLRVLALLACRGMGEQVYEDTGPVDRAGARPEDEPVATACGSGEDLDGDGYYSPATGGTDCDDWVGGARTHPGATDAERDGTDQDCDGVDGPHDDACTPVPETCDGRDEDCDGRVDDGVLVEVSGAAAAVVVGALLADGAPALVVGRTGTRADQDGAVLVHDAGGALVLTLEGTGLGTTFGQQLATGRDLTGDGPHDLVVAAPLALDNAGGVYVFAGPLHAGTTLADAVAVYTGGALDGHPGEQLGLAPDLSGDGLPELLVSNYRHVLVFSGASLDVPVATAELNTGGGPWHFAVVPDVDGDALPELVLGMETWNAGAGLVARYDSAGLAGAIVPDAYVEGGGARLTTVDDRLYTLSGGAVVEVTARWELASTPWTGTALADGGDLDGDGRSDLLVQTALGVEAPGIGAWAGSGELQTTRGLGPVSDLDGDALPDLPLRFAGGARVLDGADAFVLGCNEDGDALGRAEGDCDDGRADVLPVGGVEVCDGVDNDCDGVIDGPAEVALGWAAVGASGLGDLDGDDSVELAAMDATGLVYVLDGEGSLGERLTVEGGVAGAYTLAGAGDTDGNGFAELLLAGEESGWLGPIGESGAFADHAATTFASGTGWRWDGRVGAAGDVDADGLADVWLSLRDPDGRLAVGVFSSIPGGVVHVDEAPRTWSAPESWDTLTVAGDGDLDGDGLGDLLVGNPRSAYGGGRTMFFPAGPAGERTMDEAAAVSFYGEPGEQLGTALAMGGDYDGDGVGDGAVAGASGVKVLAGGACPIFLPQRMETGANAVALVDLDADGRDELYASDAAAVWGDAAGLVWRMSAGADAAPWRAGGVGVWSVGDSDGTGGGDLLYTTSDTTVRVGDRCQ